MQCSYKQDFIAVYDGALSPAFCAHLAARFQASPERVRGQTGHGVDTAKKHSLDLGISQREDWREETGELMNAAFSALRDYLSTYYFALVGGVAAQVIDPRSGQPATVTPENWETVGRPNLDHLIAGILRCGLINLQEYAAGAGHYGYWHHEHYPKDQLAEPLHRVLFFIFYLNDVAEGGETEFFYQRQAVQPRAGRLLIAPAGFTHTHRGTVPLSNDKLIATSWVLFQRAEQLYKA